jgi:hypothetical protein
MKLSSEKEVSGKPMSNDQNSDPIEKLDFKKYYQYLSSY